MKPGTNRGVDWNWFPLAFLQLGIYGATIGAIVGAASGGLFLLTSFFSGFGGSMSYGLLLSVMVAAMVGAVMALPGGILLGWASGFIQNRFALVPIGMICGLLVFLPFLEGPGWYNVVDDQLPLHATAMASAGFAGFLMPTMRSKKFRGLYISGIRYLGIAFPRPQRYAGQFILIFSLLILFARWIGFHRNNGREAYPLKNSQEILQEVLRLYDETPWYLPRPDAITLVDNINRYPEKITTLVHYRVSDQVLLQADDPHSGWSKGWDSLSIQALREIVSERGTFGTLAQKKHPSPFNNQQRRLPSSSQIY